MQKFKEAQKLCPFKVVPIEERVYQLRKGHFIVYLPDYTTVNIKCRDRTASEVHLKKGTQQLHIPPGCQGIFPNHLVTSDWSVRLNDSILHFEWDWDPISFMPAGEMEQMSEALKHIGELRLQLRSARSDEDDDLPAIYQEASFTTVAPDAVSPPPH